MLLRMCLSLRCFTLTLPLTCTELLKIRWFDKAQSASQMKNVTHTRLGVFILYYILEITDAMLIIEGDLSTSLT